MRLVLETTHLYQMFGDDKFYDALPPGFEPLRPIGQASHSKAIKVALGHVDDTCGGCTTVRKVLEDAINLLGRQLNAVRTTDPDALLLLKQYLSTRMKQTIVEVVLYYKDSESNNRVLRF